MYVCLTARAGVLEIRRSKEAHVHKATGCYDHSCIGPCLACIDSGECRKLPCFQCTTANLPSNSLAFDHQLATSQIQLASSSAKSTSQTVIYNQLISRCSLLRSLTGSAPYLTGTCPKGVGDARNKLLRARAGEEIQLQQASQESDSTRFTQMNSDIRTAIQRGKEKFGLLADFNFDEKGNFSLVLTTQRRLRLMKHMVTFGKDHPAESWPFAVDATGSVVKDTSFFKGPIHYRVLVAPAPTSADPTLASHLRASGLAVAIQLTNERDSAGVMKVSPSSTLSRMLLLLCIMLCGAT
jgi:hypothetical protein